MIRSYTFFHGGSLEFEDSKTVRELIEYAYGQFRHTLLPAIEIATIHQSPDPRAETGWFTRDTNHTCAEEIVNPDHLYFACQLPDVFYFAEGGWGHHMTELGNHPIISDPVNLNLCFTGFDDNVIINGNYSFADIINYLKDSHYISECSKLHVKPIGIPDWGYFIQLSDDIMQLKLVDFLDRIQQLNDEYYPDHGFIYYEIFEII